jgi:hypothetical protein
MSDTNSTTQFSQEELNNEEWRPVVGFEGIYSVSNLGRIRRELAVKYTYTGKMIKPGNHHGYPTVQLWHLSTVKLRFIHRLVAASFLGPRPEGSQVNHIDGIKDNNRPKNLEYVTPKENQRHASRLGLLAFGSRNWTRKYPERLPRGDKHPLAKLKDTDIPQIRKLGKEGASASDIACIFGVSSTAIRHIIQGYTWKHVQ